MSLALPPCPLCHGWVSAQKVSTVVAQGREVIDGRSITVAPGANGPRIGVGRLRGISMSDWARALAFPARPKGFPPALAAVLVIAAAWLVLGTATSTTLAIVITRAHPGDPDALNRETDHLAWLFALLLLVVDPLLAVLAGTRVAKRMNRSRARWDPAWKQAWDVWSSLYVCTYSSHAQIVYIPDTGAYVPATAMHSLLFPEGRPPA